MPQNPFSDSFMAKFAEFQFYALRSRAVFVGRRSALAVLLGNSLDLRGRLAQVLQDHDGVDLDLCPQREHEGFHQGGIWDASSISTTICAPLAPSTSTK